MSLPDVTSAACLQDSAKRPLFVFVHIQKTAGTSMRNALEALFGRDRIYWHGRDGMITDLAARGELERLAAFDLVGGHFTAAMVQPRDVGRPTVLVSLVRNPVDQIVSHFEFVRTRPDNRLHTGSPFAEAVIGQTEFARFSRALQCRMLTGESDGEAAFAALQRTEHIVAVVERAAQVVARVAKLAGIERDVTLGRINVAAPGYRERYDDPAAMAAVRQIAHQDFRLFHRIVENGGLSERISVQPPATAAADPVATPAT